MSDTTVRFAIPRYRQHHGFAIFSAGFRPFFLASAIWAVIGIPLWLAIYGGQATLQTAFPPLIWHAHEMIFGFAAAAVAGFLLTAIPNWTGRMPLQGVPLAGLVLLWGIGRAGILFSGWIGAPAAAVADLSFPIAFLAVVAREILKGKNWRNLPMVAALALLFSGNLLVHLEAIGIAGTAQLGNRVGIATLLVLIALVGGRIVPSFTRNWLVKNRPEVGLPHPQERLDQAALIATVIALTLWAALPDATITAWALIVAGIAIGWRLSRWQGYRTIREKLLLILHIGYGWLSVGFLVLGLNGLFGFLPMTAALHPLTIGAVGTMTLAVMTRASLGHTGRPLIAQSATQAIYVLITLAALLRVSSAWAGAFTMAFLWTAGASWSGAFGLFAIYYGKILMTPRVRGH